MNNHYKISYEQYKEKPTVKLFNEYDTSCRASTIRSQLLDKLSKMSMWTSGSSIWNLTNAKIMNQILYTLRIDDDDYLYFEINNNYYKCDEIDGMLQCIKDNYLVLGSPEICI